MATNARCPSCGHNFRLPADTARQDVRCPSCLAPLPEAPAPSSLLARAGADEPRLPPAGTNRTMLAAPEAMIRYTCPRCSKSLESPVSFAGQKLNCPDCGQRLQIPQPSTPPPPPVNKTVLAKEEAPATAPRSTSAAASPPVSVVAVTPVAEPPPRKAAPRETCLECGVDVTQRARVQTCPDCGSLLCSAACYRDHRYHAHAPKRKKRARPVECHYCGSTALPYQTSVISSGGWVVFVLLLIFFFPLCWIGLLMTESQFKCADCGARLN